MSESLEAIDERYFYLKLHYNEMMGKCQTAAQEEVVDTQFTKSVKDHDDALNKIFKENAAAVVQLRNDLIANTGALKQQMENDNQIVTILNTLTAGGELAKDLLDT
ncbi:MAG TPA: hypothetical protein VNO50_03975 [Pyrinomonadaceae bacterium]|nr:hypothetical protein [Pyrinomonadaceae bacterium]